MMYTQVRKQRFSTTVVIHFESAIGAMNIDILPVQGIEAAIDATATIELSLLSTKN